MWFECFNFTIWADSSNCKLNDYVHLIIIWIFPTATSFHIDEHERSQEAPGPGPHRLGGHDPALVSFEQKKIHSVPTDEFLSFSDLNEASLLWNMKIRYDKELIYVSSARAFIYLHCARFKNKHMMRWHSWPCLWLIHCHRFKLLELRECREQL